MPVYLSRLFLKNYQKLFFILDLIGVSWYNLMQRRLFRYKLEVGKLSEHKSVEDYLETILVLGHNDNQVRSIDIANELDYSKPSVSVAMKNLREKEYILVGDDGYITLTDVGRKIAESMYERHTLISDWLIYLGVDKKTAVEDACKMEHDISEKSFLAIKKHIEDWKHAVYSRR